MSPIQRILIPSCLAFAVLVASDSQAATYSWNVAGPASWFNAANWTPSGGPPTSSDTALINNAGISNIGNPGAMAQIVTIGSVSGTSGTLTLQGNGTLGVSSDFIVGAAGTGTFSIGGANSATLTSSDGKIGNSNGGIGTVTVANTGHWTDNSFLFVGNSGTGTLDVKNGGTVSATEVDVAFLTSSSGGITVEGTGSKLTESSTGLLVGGAGTGTLDINTGGSVSSQRGVLGFDSGDGLGSGTATLNGNSGGATWMITNDLIVGEIETGTLKLRNSAMLSNGGDAYIGKETGSIGSATVDTLSSWISTGTIYVGNDGTGSLTVKGGGVVSGFDGFVGSGMGSGTATVDGMGSKWTSSGFLDVGENSTGNTLSVTAGGEVDSVDGYIGDHQGSDGKVTVDGTGSTWSDTGDLTVGNAGKGTLSITTAGLVSDVNGDVGKAGTGVGKVTVDGTSGASKWTNSGTLIIGDAGNGTLDILAGGTVSNTSGTIGNTGTGTVTVDGMGSTWTNNGNLNVGEQGNGTLKIQNGASVSAVSSTVTIGDQNTSTGSVTVTDAMSQLSAVNVDVGNVGNGTLTIKAGGTVTDTNGEIATNQASTSMVTISGKNSSWMNSGTLTVGAGGAATLMVTAGTVSNTDGVIADNNTSTSSATFDGKNAVWTNSGDLTVGNLGNGTLSVLEGASVTSVNGFVGKGDHGVGLVTVDGMNGASSWIMTGDLTVGDAGDGTMNVQNAGSVSNVNGLIGNQENCPGIVNVDGLGSTWTNSGTLTVGGTGIGTLNVTNGGVVTNTGGTVGDVANSMGAATVDGMGSKWMNSQGLIVGAAGTGTVSVTAGGTLTNNFSAYIGEQPDGVGTVTVDGPGSTWTNGSSVDVGRGGNGTMHISDGGVVTNSTAIIGNNMDSVGLVTVDGKNSNWMSSGTLDVGDSGNGTMHISNGGAVSNAFAIIGSNMGSTGLVTVDGKNSTWTNNGGLDVGDEGDGTMHVTNGGAVTDTQGAIANDTGSTGLATVDGMGSTWINSGDLLIASEGTGELDITNGGFVSNVMGSIGQSAGAGTNGTAIVDGTGSTWTNSSLYVGGDSLGAGGSGLLRITNGGTVNAPTMLVYAPGTLEVGASYHLNAASLTFDGGTLRTIASANFINNATLASGGVTVDDDGFTSTLSGVFSGAGGLTKIGDGTIIVTNTNTYAGNTNINAGTLQLDGSITSNTFVNTGGTLSGTGTVFGNVTNSGNVSPGDSPGTLTISGKYAQNNNGTLTIEVASLTTHDLLAIGGAADLGGTLKVVKLANFSVMAGDKIIILTAAGGRNGEFATVMSDFGPTGTLVVPEVVYEPNDVALLFAQGSFLLGGGAGLTPNQIAVANNLNNSLGDPRAADLIHFLDMEQIANLPHDYDLIAPEELAALYEISFSKAIVQNQNLQHRMDDIRAGSSGFSSGTLNMTAIGGPAVDSDLSYGFTDGKVVLPVAYTDGKAVLDTKDKNIMTPTPENRWGVFVSGYGDFVNVDGNDNAHGYDISTGSVLVGLDYKVCDHFAIGLDGSYSGGQANLVDDGRIDYDGGQAGAYASIFGFKSFLGNIIHFDLAVSGGWNDYDTVRNGLQNMAVRGSTDGSEFNAMLAYGGDWNFGHWLVGTWSSLQYTNVNVNSFTETGSLAPLHFPDQSEDSIRSSTGLRLAYNANFGRTIFRPEVRAAWEHEYGDQAYPIDARFASGAGGIFTVHGPDIGRDSALVDAGFSLLWNERFSTYVFYDGNLGRSHYDNNAISGGLRFSF